MPAMGAVDGFLKGMDSMIASQERVATTILYIVPEVFRLVPITKTLTLTWDMNAFQRQQDGAWSAEGSNFLLAPFQRKDGDTDANAKVWEDWSKALANAEGASYTLGGTSNP